MKQQRKLVATLSVVVALSSFSQVIAADVNMTSTSTHRSEAPRGKVALSQAQMDQVHAGRQITPAVYRVFLNGLKNCELNVQCIQGWQNALEWYADLP